MGTKEIKVQILGPAGQTLLELESDGEQGVVHVVLRDFDSQHNEISATGTVLTLEELEELNIAITDAIQHQKRSENR